MHTPEQTVDTALIPIAGLGTRMWPYSAGAPKFMGPISVGNEFIPNINFTLDDLVAANMQNIVFVVSGEGENVLRNYIGPIPKHMADQARALGKVDYLEKEITRRDAFKDMNIEYVEQGVGAYGTAIPLNLARNALQGVKHFAVTGGDDFIWSPEGTSELNLQIASWQHSGLPHSVMGKPVDRAEGPKYGLLERDSSGEFVRIVEKPPIEAVPEKPLANISRYILSDSIWPHLDEVLAEPRSAAQPEYYITDVINKSAAAGDKFDIHSVQGTYFDAGSPDGVSYASQVMSAHLRQK